MKTERLQNKNSPFFCPEIEMRTQGLQPLFFDRRMLSLKSFAFCINFDSLDNFFIFYELRQQHKSGFCRLYNKTINLY